MKVNKKTGHPQNLDLAWENHLLTTPTTFLLFYKGSWTEISPVLLHALCQCKYKVLPCVLSICPSFNRSSSLESWEWDWEVHSLLSFCLFFIGQHCLSFLILTEISGCGSLIPPSLIYMLSHYLWYFIDSWIGLFGLVCILVFSDIRHLTTRWSH